MCLGLDQESKTAAHGGMTPTGCAMVLLSVIVLDAQLSSRHQQPVWSGAAATHRLSLYPSN